MMGLMPSSMPLVPGSPDPTSSMGFMGMQSPNVMPSMGANVMGGAPNIMGANPGMMGMNPNVMGVNPNMMGMHPGMSGMMAQPSAMQMGMGQMPQQQYGGHSVPSLNGGYMM
jgi:hypothetical protein